MELIYEIDENILLFIQEYVRNPILTPVFKFITTLGNSGIFWIILTAVFLVTKKYRKAGVAGAIALILSLIVVNLILKNAIARIRPYEIWDNLEILIALPTDYSFPSGHTSSSFAAACGMYPFIPRKLGIGLIILAALIGFSRIYFAVHYPSDVVAGFVIGAILGVISGIVVKKIANNKAHA